jgi:hypothetical protein
MGTYQGEYLWYLVKNFFPPFYSPILLVNILGLGVITLIGAITSVTNGWFLMF